jgi:hypothetical protein
MVLISHINTECTETGSQNGVGEKVRVPLEHAGGVVMMNLDGIPLPLNKNFNRKTRDVP